MAEFRGVSPSPIDADQLERIARIARGLPGRLVSVKQRVARGRAPVASEPSRSSRGPQAVLLPLLRIDGVAATEILARYDHAGLA